MPDNNKNLSPKTFNAVKIIAELIVRYITEVGILISPRAKRLWIIKENPETPVGIIPTLSKNVLKAEPPIIPATIITSIWQENFNMLCLFKDLIFIY